MIGPLAGRMVGQIGIAVRDLDAALESWAGAGPWHVYTYGPDTVPRLRYRGGPGRFTVRLALNFQTPQLELVEPLVGPSIYDGWLEQHGESVHHLAVIVDSLDEAIAVMEEDGFEAVQVGAGYGLDGDGGFAYFDTVARLGFFLEVIEVPRRRREPEVIRP